MSKFRRQNVGSPSRKVSKSLNDSADENADHQLGAKLKLNRGKVCIARMSMCICIFAEAVLIK